MNILLGIGVGILSLFVGKLFDKKLIPFNEKAFERAEKQKVISEKVSKMIEEENAKIKAEEKK